MDNQETLVPALPEGTVLYDIYQIVKILGAGGFGITYMAWDQKHERYVVIKECLPVDYATRENGTLRVIPRSGETERMFENCVNNTMQEAQTLAGFSHPGVVQIFDLFRSNGTVYYVMELISGQTLFEVMENLKNSGGTFTQEQAEGLLVNMLDILEHLHDHGIYHCDIKPGNIFIMGNGMPKLIDFGAVRSKELQHEGLVQVTPGYTPPEFYPGRFREIGPWCDLYELGATFYELLTGIVPEPGDKRSVIDRMVKIASVEGYRKKYSLPLLASIDKALEPTVDKRFKSSKMWIEYMDAYEAGVRLVTTSDSRANNRLKIASSLNKKKKSQVGRIVFLLILIALVTAVWFVHTGEIKLPFELPAEYSWLIQSQSQQ